MLTNLVLSFIIWLWWFQGRVEAQSPSILSVSSQINYVTATTELAVLFPVQLASTAPTLSRVWGFANDHVTVMRADAVVEALDHVSGAVTMQTKPNGEYTLVFSSPFYYGDNSTVTGDDYYAYAKTWITCHATASEDGVRTCDSTGEVLTGTTTTKTGTWVEPTTKVWTTTTSTYATQTSLISNSVLVTMSDHMRPASFERLLTRRTSSTDESTITAEPSTG